MDGRHPVCQRAPSKKWIDVAAGRETGSKGLRYLFFSTATIEGSAVSDDQTPPTRTDLSGVRWLDQRISVTDGLFAFLIDDIKIKIAGWIRVFAEIGPYLNF